MSGRSLQLYLLLLLSLAWGTVSAQGLNLSTASLPPGNSCLDLLPDGTSYRFDGTAVVRVTPTGGTQTVYTPPGMVFGSFVKVMPGGQALLFGESMNNTITEVGIGTLPYFRTLTTLKYNFDCAFGPQGEILVSAAATTAGNGIYLVDSRGNVDLLIQVPGASGPIEVLPGGDLLVAVVSASWPVPPGSASILRYSRQQWLSAIGASNLTERDGTVWMQGLDSLYDLAGDGCGRLYYTDTVGNLLGCIAGGTATILWQGGAMTPTHLALTHGPGPSSFAPYQPALGGHLLCLATDWMSQDLLLTATPARPDLAATPSGPVPGNSPVTTRISGGPPAGQALLLYGRSLVVPEPAFHLAGVCPPLFFGLDPAGLLPLALPLTLDNQGRASLTLTWPGGTAATLQVQALILTGAELLGSSPPCTIDLAP